MSAPIVASEEEGGKYPNLDLAQLIHQYDLSFTAPAFPRIDGSDPLETSVELKEKILSIIKLDSMLPFYESLVEKYGWSSDDSLITTMRDSNSAELQAMESKREDILKNAGDLELLELDAKKGRFFARIGDWDQAMAAYDTILVKPKAGNGRKIDACFDKIKILLFRSDVKGLKTQLAEASKLVEIGGDWDRRNKLKVFEALYCMIVRDINKAASLLQGGIATFSSTNICSYNQFMFYAIVCNLLVLPRSELKKKIIDNAHVISVIIEAPKLQTLIDSLYSCNYESMMKALLDLESDFLQDRYLGAHTVHLLREYRILAFTQFLEAYKSVLLSSMAKSFGITVAMLDRELSHFIASGRLNAKIDKVGDLVETVKSDRRNTQYQDVIKKGDILLNQIQKLGRVINQ